jgi:hypothetical protein
MTDALDALSPEHRDFFERFKSFWVAPAGPRVAELIAPDATTADSLATAASVADGKLQPSVSRMIGVARVVPVTRADIVQLLEREEQSGQLKIDDHDIIRRVFESLAPGGAFILVEKILGATARLDEAFVELFLQIKRENGYSERRS